MNMFDKVRSRPRISARVIKRLEIITKYANTQGKRGALDKGKGYRAITDRIAFSLRQRSQ